MTDVVQIEVSSGVLKIIGEAVSDEVVIATEQTGVVRIVEAGIQGPVGNSGSSVIAIDPASGNRLANTVDGLYVPPVRDGELPDMVLIFENALA